MNMEVVAVDTAGNTIDRSVASNRAILETTAANLDGENRIHYSTCGAAPNGTYCAPVASGAQQWRAPHAANFPNGYYTCRAGGCCTGSLACTPFN